MPGYEFYQVDVFTRQAFGGNPLAVFPDASRIATEDMQAIAREMNLSETTFVLPPDSPDADFRVRIFTPEREMSFAGHPVIGTHWTLAYLGKVTLLEPITIVKFQLGVGIRRAVLHVQAGKVTRVVMDHMKPEFGAIANPALVAQLAEGLGLPVMAIEEAGWPVQVVSSGIRQLFVPIRSLKEIEALTPGQLRIADLTQVCKTLDPEQQCNGCVMVLTPHAVNSAVNVHTRMFGVNLGIPEDPATGSAAGGLGAYLVEHKIIQATAPTTHIVAEQGIEMNRPSRLEIEVDGEPGNIGMIRVGGEVVPVIQGTINW